MVLRYTPGSQGTQPHGAPVHTALPFLHRTQPHCPRPSGDPCSGCRTGAPGRVPPVLVAHGAPPRSRCVTSSSTCSAQRQGSAMCDVLCTAGSNQIPDSSKRKKNVLNNGTPFPVYHIKIPITDIINSKILQITEQKGDLRRNL